MSKPVLKSAAQVVAIVSGADHQKVNPERRSFLAEKVASSGDEIEHVLPVLLAAASNAEEAAFLRALVTTAPPKPAPAPKGEKGETEVHD